MSNSRNLFILYSSSNLPCCVLSYLTCWVEFMVNHLVLSSVWWWSSWIDPLRWVWEGPSQQQCCISSSLNSCWLWGEDDADCGEGGLPMKTTTESGWEFESFPENIYVWSALMECPKIMFNVLNWRQNLQSISNWKLLKCSEQGKLWNQESAEVVGFGLPLICTRQRRPRLPTTPCLLTESEQSSPPCRHNFIRNTRRH